MSQTLFQLLKSYLHEGTLLSYFFALVLAYFGGIISSFTPCIYPMIPITVGFIGGVQERTLRQGLLLSATYVLGMATVYAVLGVFAGLSGRIFGTFTNSTGWYLFLGGILTLSSLWMMDIIQFDPIVFMNRIKLQKHRKKKSKQPTEHTEATVLGAFILGSSSGFIAAPCTTPVLTTILSFIATEKSVFLGVMLMFSFAIGLGTLLVLVGTFTGALKILPRSGKWLELVKKLSGILILLLGEYFIFKAGRI